MIKRLYKSRFVRDNAIFMTGTLLGGLFGYLFHFVVSRQMSVSQYGELQSLLSTLIIFGVFNSALSYFVIRHTSVFAAHEDYEANREFIDYVSGKVSKLTLALLVVSFAASPFLAGLLHFSSIFGFFIVSLATFFSTMMIVYTEILKGWQKFLALNIIGVAVALIKLLSGAGLANFFHEAYIVSFSFLFSASAGWYFARRYSLKQMVPDGAEKRKGESWKEKYFSETSIKKTAVRIFFFSLALILVSNLDVVLVKYFSSPETAGYFGAFALVGKIIIWLNLAVTSVMLPGACAEGHLGKRPDRKHILGSYGLMAVIGAALISIYYFAPNGIIRFFFGAEYIFEPQTLWLFGIMSFLLSILTFEANLSFAKHDFRVSYLLAATVFLMIAVISKYHASLSEIVLAFSVSFLAGYILVTSLNLIQERNRMRRRFAIKE